MLKSVFGQSSANPGSVSFPVTLSELRKGRGWKVNAANNLVAASFAPTNDGKEPSQIIQANAAMPVKYFTYFPYFEVTISSIAKGGVIAVGLADEKIPLEQQLPGWVQNSFGFHSDDGCVYSQYGGLGMSYGFSFGKGDIIGCGLIRQLDGRNRLFFTVNGVSLGTIMTTFVPGTKQIIPTVGADATCSILANFGAAPFAWKDMLSSAISMPVSKLPTASLFDLLPAELFDLIVYFGANDAKATSSLGRINKQFRASSTKNPLWRQLYLERWPNQSKNMKVKNWQKFYRQRHIAFPVEVEGAIEGCEMEFECPLKWQSLTKTGNSSERHCNTCNKTVTNATSQAELVKLASEGRCVTFVMPDLKANVRKMGKPAYPRNR